MAECDLKSTRGSTTHQCLPRRRRRKQTKRNPKKPNKKKNNRRASRVVRTYPTGLCDFLEWFDPSKASYRATKCLHRYMTVIVSTGVGRMCSLASALPASALTYDFTANRGFHKVGSIRGSSLGSGNWGIPGSQGSSPVSNCPYLPIGSPLRNSKDGGERERFIFINKNE